MKHNYEELAMAEMEKSECQKRKVGALVVDEFGEVLGKGHNLIKGDQPCENADGTTKAQVIHAELVALNDAFDIRHKHLMRMSKPKTMYITHAPCQACAMAIRDAGILEVIIVDKGIKHDQDKLKLSLIPTQLINGVGEVMTFGAKKYKKDNWKNLDDPTRYLDALMRHLEAYRSGEEFDEETGLPHLAHLATNAGFLLWFDEERTGWGEED